MDMKYRDACLRWRGIEPTRETICKKCSGSGVITYGSTATWRGGIGGQMMTNDVCDCCWGSGKENEKWLNLKKLQGLLNKLKINPRNLY